MVESDHGEAAEEVKTMPVSGGGDVDAKKVESVAKRPREDSSGDESSELPHKRQRSEANDRSPESDMEKVAEPAHKTNGSSTLNNDDTMNVDEEELSNENSKNASANSEEKTDDVASADEKDSEEKTHNDSATNNEDAEQKKENTDKKDEKDENGEKVIFILSLLNNLQK